MSGWWILYMTGVILGAGLICAFSRQLPRPKCTNSPRVKYSKSGLKPNRTFELLILNSSKNSLALWRKPLSRYVKFLTDYYIVPVGGIKGIKLL